MKLNQIGKLLQNKIVLAALLMTMVAGTMVAGVLTLGRGNHGEQKETEPGYAFQTQEAPSQELLQNPQEEFFEPQEMGELPEKKDPEPMHPVQSGKVELPAETVEVPQDLQQTAEEIQDMPALGETLVEAEGAVIYEPEEEVLAQVAPALEFRATSTMGWPIFGNVILDYSMDTTTYFPTLDQYKCNPGILIQAEVGQPVAAAVQGQVLALEHNEELGDYIVMDLGGEYTMIYGQLEQIRVEPGQRVEAGEILAVVASPTKYYVVEGPHVYVELRHQETPVDPLDHIR